MILWKKIILLVLITFFSIFQIWFLFCLPAPLFEDPYSVVVLDKNKELLGVKISNDGQWRFPETDSISHKFKICITTYEDKRFFYHFGVDPIAVVRAIEQNYSNSRVVSGGSTITMQTVRLFRKGKERTFGEKTIEALMAVRLELKYSKNEILNLYASHAPFGGNVVGIEAAAWRYFGRVPAQLSWAENAMLAVLPNAPSMIHTARNRDMLKLKRDRLLHKLYKEEYLTLTELELAIEEEIPEHPQSYPMYAYHLVNRAAKEHAGTINKIETTVDIKLQKQTNDIIKRYNDQYLQSGINNIACLVLEVETGNTVIYIGNAGFNSDVPEKDVDMVAAVRSTGSLLKPFLYAAMLSSGGILPKSLQKDIPTRMGGFSPENFDRKYEGAVFADEALARSLNIPFVYMLKEYGVLKFLHILQSLGLKTINKSSEHYGLSLVLGGGESSLWDMCSAYASMSRSLKNFTANDSRYFLQDYRKAGYVKNYVEKENKNKLRENSFLSAASIWYTFEAMASLNRPGQEKQWEQFSSRQKISWKTGTSFGFKDAWSVAVTPKYVVGIWVGNATGEGKSGIVGLNVAAPVLFEVLNVLPDYDRWFDFPFDELMLLPVCRKSGYLAGQDCDLIDSLWMPRTGANSNICPYHRKINLDETETFIVNSNCYPFEKIIRKSWFVLPPAMEYYYKVKKPWYQTLPSVMEGCNDFSVNSSKEIMDIIYPNKLSRVYIPVDINSDTLPAVFHVAHRDNDALIYWYIDDNYIGTTKDFHEKEFKLPSGKYILNLMDNKGNKMSRSFSVVSDL